METHFFLCVLAYHLLISIEKSSLDNGIHTSWATVRDQLRSHQVVTTVLPTTYGSELRSRQATVAEPDHRATYRGPGITQTVMRRSGRGNQGGCSDEN